MSLFAIFALLNADALKRRQEKDAMGLMSFANTWPQTPEDKRLAKALESAVTEVQVDEDDFWHGLDEHGVPCMFFKDGTRKYA